MFSRILLQEKYATPHNKIKNAELMINASFLEGRAHKSQGNTPQLPTLKRNLRSSSPSKIKIMNKYKEKNHNDKKSIFFPKISNNPGNLDNNINMNEFTVKKTAEFAKDLSLLNLKKSKVLEKFEGKIFNKFPKGFFPNSEQDVFLSLNNFM